MRDDETENELKSDSLAQDLYGTTDVKGSLPTGAIWSNQSSSSFNLAAGDRKKPRKVIHLCLSCTWKTGRKTRTAESLRASESGSRKRRKQLTMPHQWPGLDVEDEKQADKQLSELWGERDEARQGDFPSDFLQIGEDKRHL